MTAAKSIRPTYDNPELSAVDFLLCIMHDVTLPIAVRADAAGKLLPICREMKTLTVRIVGGLPDDFTPAEPASLDTKDYDNVYAWSAKHFQSLNRVH